MRWRAKALFCTGNKGTNSEFDLRLKEMLKIKCGKAHFTAIETGVVFNEAPVMSWRDSKPRMVVERVEGCGRSGWLE
ncbi:hypothetical protein [Bartonella sp. CM120XJJH]|uniref:restriction endonuclease n=1 Tax=Bartonella sp. CM120XJJH TaxID=3243544 RepID=UPI0035D0F915